VQLKKLLEHFTEVKQLMTMSHVRVCEKEMRSVHPYFF